MNIERALQMQYCSGALELLEYRLMIFLQSFDLK